MKHNSTIYWTKLALAFDKFNEIILMNFIVVNFIDQLLTIGLQSFMGAINQWKPRSFIIHRPQVEWTIVGKSASPVGLNKKNFTDAQVEQSANVSLASICAEIECCQMDIAAWRTKWANSSRKKAKWHWANSPKWGPSVLIVCCSVSTYH